MNISASTIVLAVVGILILFGLFTSFYTVQAESQGIVLRFGKYYNTVGSGLQFKLPFGIDQVLIVPVERQLKQEFGFYTSGGTNVSQYSVSTAERNAERSMVTGDLNAASVEWVIQYRITDPKQFLFEVRSPEFTLRDIAESVMRAVVGDRTVDEVITIGRQEIEGEALIKMQELVQKYQLGLSINQVQLKDVNPPQPVQPSFNEVNQAQQQKEQMINVANGEYNKVVPRARGEAEQKIQEAEGYALKRVNEAEGDVANFVAVLEEYKKAKDVTKQRLYLETMQEVIPNMGEKIIIDEGASQILPLLNLGKGAKE
ncbi:MAG: FtsH protease activity modulator HflK [Verrucomicrobiota bacterium]